MELYTFEPEKVKVQKNSKIEDFLTLGDLSYFDENWKYNK